MTTFIDLQQAHASFIQTFSNQAVQLVPKGPIPVKMSDEGRWKIELLFVWQHNNNKIWHINRIHSIFFLISMTEQLSEVVQKLAYW